ncbi:MAG: hypothetical protein M3P30_06935 [Chloroflexota bacterium]|nr:hypothetical protein [Chloroflexota bacterium]
MKLSEEMFRLSNDYVARRIELRALASWTNDHLVELAELPDEDPGGALWGFVQIRIYDMDHGLPEDELRKELRSYLSEHRLEHEPQRRATG